MTGIWLASYIVLWLLVVGMCLLVLGSLRQVGLLRHHLAQRSTEDGAPAAENEGPAIGSLLPGLVADTTNGGGR